MVNKILLQKMPVQLKAVRGSNEENHLLTLETEKGTKKNKKTINTASLYISYIMLNPF